ncbi:MAG: Protein kinase [Myxococcaceae bacterium]|nr:Protein kinase [Myxococcaceae bacterium]
MAAASFISSSSSPIEGADAIQESDGAESDRLALGSIVGERYQLRELLGRGGMGSVYAAHDIKRNVFVAIKLMHAHLGRMREAQRRFRNEAGALHRVRSDHVARLYDFGHHQNGAPYLVMEHVSGHDLTHEVTTRGKLPWAEAHSIIEQICTALEAVHAAGLVHRDLKPRNVVVSRSDGVLLAKVVDFGLSKSYVRTGRTGAPITREGMAVGSLHYMAPEQAIASPRVDARADVFSVGCILYYLLMGEPPFSQRALTRAGRTGNSLTFSSIHHRRDDVPAYVDEVLRVALSPGPDQRFRTMGALRMALQSDIPGISAEAHVRTLMVRARIERPFWWVTIAALCSMTLAVGAYLLLRR